MAVVDKAQHVAAAIVDVPDHIAAGLFCKNGAAVQEVIRRSAANGLAGADAVCVVEVAADQPSNCSLLTKRHASTFMRAHVSSKSVMRCVER